MRRAGGAQEIARPDGWRLGGPAPWPIPGGPIAINEILGALAGRSPAAVVAPPRGALPSAVLVLLTDGDQGAEVLLTRRSMRLNNHRGEISFPGGRVDGGEDVVMAALRETHEEVGVPPQAVRVAGELLPIGTYVSRSWISSVVGVAAAKTELRLSTDEVDRAFWVPLSDLTKPGTFREEWWPTPVGDRPIFFFELDDETVWGATARLLHQLLRVAHGIVGPEPPAL